MNNPSQDSDFDLDFSALTDLASLADAIAPAPQNPASEGEKHIVFQLEDKLYAINCRQVAEVVGFLPVTPLPFVPDWIAGITNLRGDLISVADLRKLWRKTSPPPAKSKMLVLRSEKKNQPIAFIVDKLSEIITLTPQEIEFSAADFASSFPTFFGRVNRSAQTVYLLDAENLFSSLSPDGV
jgi:purine-binding chemotaxis protein CheW